MKIQVELKVLDPRMQEQLPAYGTPGSAGIDLRACLTEPLTLQPGQAELVPQFCPVQAWVTKKAWYLAIWWV